jgi:leucyl-tRNA synthetase
LRRVWNFAAKNEAALRAGIAGPRDEAKFNEAAKALRKEIHTTLKQINFDFERIQYNTVVSGCMKLLNAMEAADASAITPPALAECFSILLRVLYPVCPHITESLWGELGYAECCGELLNVAWADVDEKALVSDTVELVLQINGKTRGVVVVASNADKATIETAALATAEVAKFGEGRTPKKIIVVPGRLVSVVV